MNIATGERLTGEWTLKSEELMADPVQPTVRLNQETSVLRCYEVAINGGDAIMYELELGEDPYTGREFTELLNAVAPREFFDSELGIIADWQIVYGRGFDPASLVASHSKYAGEDWDRLVNSMEALMSAVCSSPYSRSDLDFKSARDGKRVKSYTSDQRPVRSALIQYSPLLTFQDFRFQVDNAAKVFGEIAGEEAIAVLHEAITRRVTGKPAPQPLSKKHYRRALQHFDKYPAARRGEILHNIYGSLENNEVKTALHRSMVAKKLGSFVTEQGQTLWLPLIHTEDSDAQRAYDNRYQIVSWTGVQTAEALDLPALPNVHVPIPNTIKDRRVAVKPILRWAVTDDGPVFVDSKTEHINTTQGDDGLETVVYGDNVFALICITALSRTVAQCLPRRRGFDKKGFQQFMGAPQLPLLLLLKKDKILRESPVIVRAQQIAAY